MCGIAGIYIFDDAPATELKVIQEMTGCIVHRGPDEEGTTIFSRAALGNRRLKIIDLQTGQQPMCNETGSIWLTFNGEIYNYRELRDQLISFGHHFQSVSDTEVIIHAYETWREEAFSRFNGQFAIAIYDKSNHRLVLSRDRLGIKPLYYTVQNGHLIFGSEIKSLLLHPLVEARLNPYALTSYLSYRYPMGKNSWYDEIFMLQPGELLTAGRERFDTKMYWQLPLNSANNSKPDETEMIEQVRSLMEDAVCSRMTSDVPIGAYLSGGLDSSIIVAIMAQYSLSPVKTFTIGFEEDEFNEFNYARLVAVRYATDHHEIILQPNDYISLLPKLIPFKDAPLSVPNEVPLYVMSKELKKYITVVLSGEGADELFAGYGRIFRSPFDFQRMKELQNGSLHLSQTERKILTSNLESLYQKLFFDSPMAHFLYHYSYTPFADQQELFTDDFKESIGFDIGLQKFWQTWFDASRSLSHEQQYKWLFQKFHLEGLLLRTDMTTMATAVEARVPFVDHRLIEYILENVPFDYLIPWRSSEHQRQATLLNSAQISEQYDIPKYLLREAFRNDLPEEILTRKKVGFPVPLDRWLQGELGNLARDILMDTRTRQRGIFRTETITRWLDVIGPQLRLGQIIWMLVNVELWFRTYIDRRN